MIIWPDDLILDIARRVCVLYIGAGVSANSISSDGMRPPTWNEFLRKALNEISGDKAYIEKLLSENDMLTACEVIVNHLGEHKFNDIAQNCFRRPGFNPATIHETIYNLDSRFVISPNVDKIYDQYASSKSSGTVVIKKYNDKDISNFIRTQDRIILKAHGSIDDPLDMIFSKRQYNIARYNYAGFYKILDSLALTHTYIFIGCGLNDPDIKLTLENYNFGFPGCRPHYFVSSVETMNNDIEKTLYDNCNIKVLKYKNNDGDHENLLLSLRELVEKVEEERSYIAGSQNW